MRRVELRHRQFGIREQRVGDPDATELVCITDAVGFVEELSSGLELAPLPMVLNPSSASA